MYLDIRNLTKSFGELVAVDSVSLGIGQSEFVCLLGPSGCGKTTLLRMVSGLVMPDSGEILLDGRDLTDVPARQRGFGIVFQSYSLFPNMTAAENIGYGLLIRKVDRQQIAARVAELVQLIGLQGHEDKHPHLLSGGQQQRVALARAIAVNPRLLLLDEPLSALDAQVRVALREEIRDIQQKLGIPTLMVTHDQEEAMNMADRVVCMNFGRIEQAGTPEDVYRDPASPFVANFIGRMNMLELGWPPRLGGRPLKLPDQVEQAKGERICIRPEAVVVRPSAEMAGPNSFEARVVRISFSGNLTRLTLEVDGCRIDAERQGRGAWKVGDALLVELPPDALRAY